MFGLVDLPILKNGTMIAVQNVRKLLKNIQNAIIAGTLMNKLS